jgi:hypothetical protein
MRIDLQRVHYMPKDLQPGILYVSEQFYVAIHLCACGCGLKVKTPLGPTGWSVLETKRGVTLRPSVGNWQQPCRSHYLIADGEIVWAPAWSEEEVATGRRYEERRREAHYAALNRNRGGSARRFWRWVKAFLDR